MIYTAIRKSKKASNDNPSRDELIIKAQLEQWVCDVKKKAELEQRLKKAFENSKSHVSSLSET
ncbi:hypothetical protein [Nitrosopumilus ureiphilus]|uniref:Uncharacterized protein n=1 Tax=Nitrosopumilus ureiphilus TaxID=1470067 RepID=A0A7D5R6N0_9ARCH|nr:hypothetical protein [Nitrosopumilus ureiphilus]QLH07097.1 hypothetical protein C5F50_08450 [Nitrosopumilus ureiphilus]